MTTASSQSLKAYVDGYQEKVKAQKELVETLKAQWKLLWTERFSDKIRAEEVSLNDYTSLSVERGTIIHANRDFKTITFKEILEQHEINNPDRYIQPDAHTGGWSKFVKTKIVGHKLQASESNLLKNKKQEVQQPKKGGRGWLHAV
jgi:hypothetical protein